MTLDELIATLEKVRGDGSITGYKGGFKVVVSCPDAGVDCHVRDDSIEIAHGDLENSFIRITGEIGA